ncbi:MAG: hypothetical protein II304_03215 [Bacteroidales bacterium]|jgi:hypothetical protein|nr:hypothetical protein [Bacteroidales bacterium]
MIKNVVVGKPIIDVKTLIAVDDIDWNNNEKESTLFTETRFLPAIMKEAGIISSTNEVRRNRPDLVKTLKDLDCIWIKWGKKFLYIIVGN